MDAEKIKTLSQKQIKAIKRDCLLNGLRERGYGYTILNTQAPTEIIGIITDLVEKGYNISHIPEAYVHDLVVEELIRQSSYQEFKNVLLPHIMG